MATKAELIARIAAEVRIIEETIIEDDGIIRTYVIRHERIRGFNAQGRTITLWVYDENGANDQALMDYGQWQDVPIVKRYADYVDTLIDTKTRYEYYKSVQMMCFTEINSTSIEKIGIWNRSTDLLDVYESDIAPAPPSKIALPIGYFAFGEGYRETSIPVNPQDGKANAIKLPIFETAGLMQPQGNGFIDTANHQIVMPEGYECFKIDFNLTISITGATGGSGTNFFAQWQRNGAWIGKEYQSGYIKGDDLTLNLSLNVMVQDAPTGISYFDFWMWTEGRQGDIDLRDVTCVAMEINYDASL